MFYKALYEAMNFNLGFFIEVIRNNLLWVFIFAFLIYIIFPKHRLKYFIIFTIIVWAILDMGTLVGLGFTGATLVTGYYITKIIVVALFDLNPTLRKYIPAASYIHGYVFILLFTFLVAT